MKSLLRNFTALIALACVALMPNMAFATGPTALTPITLKQNNYSVVAGDLTITFTACDNVNGNYYPATGQEIVFVQNTDSATHTFTVSSVADNLGRTDSSLTGYSVLVSPGIVAIQMKQLQGWLQSGQTVNLSCNSALLKFAVVRYN